MMSRLLLTAATAAAVAVVTAGDIPAEADEFDETNVITMTGENFNDMLEMHRPIMVDFYAPWCGHCKHLAPAYARAADLLETDYKMSRLKLAKLDATTAPEIAGKYGVTGFPTMVLYTRDKDPTVTDGSTGEDINLKQLGPHNDVFIAAHVAQLVTGHHWVTKLKSGTAVQHFRDKSEISCVMFADGEVHPGMADTFAEALDDMPANFAAGLATPEDAPNSIGNCELGEACLVVYHATLPEKTTAISEKELIGMDANLMTSFMNQADLPPEVRRGPFLSPWMKQVILLGDKDHTAPDNAARKTYDYAAKGSSVDFSDVVMQTHAAHKWAIEASQHKGVVIGEDGVGRENAEFPTMMIVDIEKGKLKKCVIWHRTLMPRAGEDQNDVVEQARTWVHEQFGLTSNADATGKSPSISAADLAANPHLAGSVEDEVVYDVKMTKEEELAAAGYDKHSKHKDFGGANPPKTLEDFGGDKDDYHTHLKDTAKRAKSDASAEKIMRAKNLLRSPKGEKTNGYTGVSAKRAGMSAEEVAEERAKVDYVAVVEACSSIGQGEKIKEGPHAGHQGLDKYMGSVGFWYINTLRSANMVYTKACGHAGNGVLEEPHIRIVKGKDASDADPYEWPTYETILTDGMAPDDIVAKLAGYGISAPRKPHDEM